MTYQPTPEGKDARLWHLAQKRTSFKKHLATYIIINGFLWGLWYMGKGNFSISMVSGKNIPWPVWGTFGWGIGLFFHYLSAYVNTGVSDIEKEYEKLKQNQK